MSTIADVAELAGVSQMTVSRVINGGSKVSEKTKNKVEKAIRELDYHPNMMAKGLATGTNHTLAYVIPDIADPYFGAVLSGAEKACLETEYSLNYFSAGTKAALDQTIKTMIQRNVAGVAFHDLDVSGNQVKMLTDAGIACVLVDCEKKMKSDGISTIEINHYEAAKHIGEIIICQGYTNVACVRGSTSRSVPKDPLATRRQKQRRIWAERSGGFKEAFRAYPEIKLFDYEIEISRRANNYAIGQNAAEVLVDRLNEPLAVYCCEDVIALGVVGYMQEHGIEMPEQIAIFGTDGLDMATTLYPRLSTAVHPRSIIGDMAIRELFGILRDKKPNTHQVINIDNYFCGDTTRKF